MTELVKKTADMVKSKFLGEGSGHDWWHMYRVWTLAKKIAEKEDVNMEIVELGALLHDIADYKFHDGNESLGGEVTREWLESLGAKEDLINEVVHIVDNISFKGSTFSKMESLEGKVVRDADRLDALGAIGIARCFTVGGSMGNEIYNPEIKPRLNLSKEEFKKHNGTQINHFYEKLLLLKDAMNTKTGKELAIHRHEFLEKYLEEFFEEWEGKK
jgi:uncharacterized protein